MTLRRQHFKHKSNNKIQADYYIFLVNFSTAIAMAERTSFFQSGRDYESRYVNHRYLREEKKVLCQYESVDYFSPHSQIYKVRLAFPMY